MSLYADLKAAITALEDIRGLKSRLERMAEILDDMDERLTRLEAREELIIERATSAAREAASIASQRMSETTFERVVSLEARLADMHRRLPPPE